MFEHCLTWPCFAPFIDLRYLQNIFDLLAGV